MDMKTALGRIAANQHLNREEMASVMGKIMTGETTDAQIGAFLMGLRIKGETVDEITGAAEVMRKLSTKVHVDGDYLVDTCGTGGDGFNLFNLSTASAFVVAAAGCKVAKHGNRGVSSNSGSADVLEAAGVNLNISAEQVARSIEELGVGFMFAPTHHSAMKYAIGPRKEMAMRTIFNLLGPITNPANVSRQVIGIFSKSFCRPIAEVLQQLGSTHVLVVHSEDGLDEISLATSTHVAELKNGTITEYSIHPEDFDIQTQSLDGLEVANAEESLSLIKTALGKNHNEISEKARDLIALNAGAAIYAADLADTLKEGIQRAADAIGSGLALAKIFELASFNSMFKES